MGLMLPKYRVMGISVLVGLMVGCAVAPIVPNANLTTAPMEVPSTGLSVAPSVAPSAGEAPPCNPETSSMTVMYESLRGQNARDWVLLGRCEERFIQRVGQSPTPLAFRIEDFDITWLAPDASFALGLRHATPTAHDLPQQLIKRFADGRPDELLSTESIYQYWISPDGGTIAFLTRGAMVGDPPEPSFNLSLLRTETGEVREVATAVADLGNWTQWSPDGDRLLFQHALGGEPRTADRSQVSIAWTSWDEPMPHRMPGNAASRYDLHRGMMTWAPDSRQVLIFDQNPMIPNRHANLVTLDFAGKEVSRPIVGPDEKQLTYFVPIDIVAGNRLMVGYNGLLDAETCRFLPHAIEGVLRWSLEPGKLLRWRMMPEGPVLDTVGLDGVAR